MTIGEIKVSVILCTYNGEAYLDEQLNSIVEQTFPLYELLVFDDASTDSTTAIIRSYMSKHPFIRLIENEGNIGFRQNFQQALAAATGDVIAIADQDDIWMKNKIERMLQVWDATCPVIYCNSVSFKNKVPQQVCPNRKRRRFHGKDGRRIFFANSVSGHAMMFRSTLRKKVFPIPENVMYDWWIAVTAAYNGGLQYLPEILVLHRVHDRNISIDQVQRSLVESVIRHKKEAIKHCEAFASVTNITGSHQQFALTFARLMRESLCKNFHFSLYLFLLQHCEVIFYFRNKKWFAVPSYLKHSYRLSLGNAAVARRLETL